MNLFFNTKKWTVRALMTVGAALGLTACFHRQSVECVYGPPPEINDVNVVEDVYGPPVVIEDTVGVGDSVDVSLPER